MSLEELSRFGQVYESRGVKYLRTPNCHVGIRADRAKAFTGVVEKAEPASSGWVKVKLQGAEQPFHIHQNRFAKYGWLKPGDRMEGVLDIGDPRQITAWYVRKVVEDKVGEMEEVA